MRSHGWPYAFEEVPWDDIATFLGDMGRRHSDFQYLADVANSVIDTGAATLLAGCTSMHDLIVVSRPISDPPFDVLAVRAPGGLRPPEDGNVLIEHLSCTGHDDLIQRPAAEAVALFWRFSIEKFGIGPPDRPRPAREG